MASQVKAQIQAENLARVQRQKLEQRFMSGMADNFRLSGMDDVKKKLDEEVAVKRIEMASPRVKATTPKPVAEDPIRCVNTFQAKARLMETTHGGSTIWTAEEDGSIGIRNGVNGNLCFRIERQDDATVEGIFATDTTMWVGLSDGKTRIYDQQVFVLAFEGCAHEGAVTAFAQSFDEKTFSTSEDGTVVKWDTEENKFGVLSRITDFGCAQRCLHCYGYSLFVGGDDGVVRSFDSETNALLRVFESHTDRVTSIVVLDGYLFTAGWDKKICVWNIGTGECLASIEGHEAPITSMMCDPIGHHLWSVDQKGVLNVWSSSLESNFALIHTIQHESPVHVTSLKGVVAIDAVKLWSCGSNGANKVWHSSRNRIEEAIKDALRVMKSIIDQDEIELAKWADLIHTLREVAAKLNATLASTLESTQGRSTQRTAYFMWLRWILFAKLRKTKLHIVSRLEISTKKESARRYFKTFQSFLFDRKRQRSNAALSTVLKSISDHKFQYTASRKLLDFVGNMKKARTMEKNLIMFQQGSSIEFARFAYDRWRKARDNIVDNKKKTAMAVALAISGDQGSLASYYQRWLRYTNLRPERKAIQTLASMSQANNDADLRRRLMAKWAMYARQSRARKSATQALNSLLGLNSGASLRVFYEKWLRYSQKTSTQKLHAKMNADSATLEELRTEGEKMLSLMERQQLLNEVQAKIDSINESRKKKLEQLQLIRDENADLQHSIDNKIPTRVVVEKTPQDQVVDLLALLKCKLINFHVDYGFVNKVVERCKKLPPSKIFLEAHQQVKRVIVELTKKPYLPQDSEWGVTISDAKRMKSHHCETILAAIKSMIITFDVMSPKERASLSSDTEIAVNANGIQLLADQCIAVRLKRFGKAGLLR